MYKINYENNIFLFFKNYLNIWIKYYVITNDKKILWKKLK